MTSERMPANLALSISVHDEVPAEEARVVDAALGRSNELAAPLHQVLPLSCFARRPGGEVIGGAVGRTWGTCCELQQLWVDPQHRRQGVATRLIKQFEARAGTRGCRTFYLETFSFQAPCLYRALGYRAAVELSGFAPGISKYLMLRHSDDDAGGALNLAPIEMKAFVPARDFELSTRFYRAIGFTLVWSSDELAYFRYGQCSFLLQNFYAEEFAENFAVHLLVQNVDHWHRHVVAQNVAGRFGARVEAPEDRPWGMRDFTLLDPGGVLWRIAQHSKVDEKKAA